MSQRGKDWVQIYVTWEMRERLRRLAQIEDRKLVAVVDQMIKDREARYQQKPE